MTNTRQLFFWLGISSRNLISSENKISFDVVTLVGGRTYPLSGPKQLIAGIMRGRTSRWQSLPTGLFCDSQVRTEMSRPTLSCPRLTHDEASFRDQPAAWQPPLRTGQRRPDPFLKEYKESFGLKSCLWMASTMMTPPCENLPNC